VFSFDFRINGPNGEATLPLTYRLPFTPSEPPEPFTFSVCFKEHFVGAFKSQSEEAEYRGQEGVGFAHHGTRLRVRFSNLPPLFRLAVTKTDLGACRTPDGSAAAVLCSPEPRQESRKEEGLEYVQLKVSGGAAIAEWECVGARKSGDLKEIRMGVRLELLSLEQAASESSLPDGTSLEFIGFYGRYRMGLHNGPPVGIAGCLAPVSTVDYAGISDPIPRFRDDPQGYQAVRFATPY
jgi:hypothetical protein